LAANRPQADSGTEAAIACRLHSRPPSAAEKAIGMPKEKATPSTACGIETQRLVNG